MSFEKISDTEFKEIYQKERKHKLKDVVERKRNLEIELENEKERLQKEIDECDKLISEAKKLGVKEEAIEK